MKDEQIDHLSNSEPAINSGERDWFWLGACAAITALASILRFADLALKPLHHDEGVNGFFLTDLFRKGAYHYDPANYHGPTLYYIALFFAKLFGLETVPVRASVAIWGVLTVILCFYLRPYIGRAGSLFAGLFVALSPGMVFISRYFIHETFFVFLSLALVVSIVFFIEQRQAGPLSIFWLAIILLTCFLPSTISLAGYLGGDNTTRLWIMWVVFFLIEAALVFFVIRMVLSWEEGRAIYFLLAAACIALLFATKETAFITLGTMLIACFFVWIWARMYKPSEGSITSEINDSQLTWRNFVGAVGVGSDRLLLIVASAALAIYLIVLFFSSFFTYAEGVRGFYKAYSIWTQTGSKDHTQNGMWAYLRWGLADPSAEKVGLEAPLFILSAIGMLVALLRARHRFAIFVGLWAFGLFAAYTLIPYKTPWLAMSFLLPMCIISGYVIGQFAESKSNPSRFAAVGLGVIAAAVMAYQTYDLNFVNYANNDKPYVYAHTLKEFNGLIDEIGYYAEKSGKGKEAQVEIVSPDYWPMVWYLKDYSHANFWGHIIDINCGPLPTCSEMIVAKKDEQDADVIRKYSSRYEYVGSWGLRPGVELILLVRKDLADPGAEDLYRINAPPRK